MWTSTVRKLISILFATTLLVPAPVAAAWIRTTDETVRARAMWLRSVFETMSDGATRERKGVRPSPVPTKAEREAKVARIEINVSAEIELKSRQRLLLSAVPVDVEGNAVQGLTAAWES